MATTPLKLAFFGDGGTDTVQGTSFYHDVAGYSSGYTTSYDRNVDYPGELAAAGPSEAAVARFIHAQAPSDVIELGDLSYNYNASTLLDRNLGQYYNAFLYPYPSPRYTDPNGGYAQQVLRGQTAVTGGTQWPYNLYNWPQGFPDSTDGAGAGGSSDRNRFWFTFGNHDYSSFLGDADPSVTYLQEESTQDLIPGGNPLGPDLFQAAAVTATGAATGQRLGNTLQQLLDYLPWLSTDPLQQEAYLAASQRDREGVILNVGKVDPTGAAGVYYSVQLGDDGTGAPLVHLQFIDSTRLVSNAGYYDFFPADPGLEPQTPKIPDYTYNPAEPSSRSLYNQAAPDQGQEMLAWSRQDLLASKARWQIVVPHHTTYGPGATFDNLSTKAYNTNPILISYLSSLNTSMQAADPAKGLDFVINGDSHYYCRVLEQQAVPGGVGLGIPIITLGNGGIRPASINLVPYGTPVNQPVNLGNYQASKNGTSKLRPADGLAMPASQPVSAGASGYYSYTSNNVDPEKKEVSPTVINGHTYQFNQPVYNYGATAEDGNYQADTGTDVSGLYGYGQGAAITEVDADYFLLRYHTVEVLDPAIVSLAPAGTAVSRGSVFYNDWSPTTAKLKDLALFSFDLNAQGEVTAVALAQGGSGYWESTGGTAEVMYAIPGNNPASEADPQQARVRLTFREGALSAVALVDGGAGYSLVANALQQQNGYVPVDEAPDGATNTPTAGILIGLNIELEEQYTLAAKAPDDQPLYSDWYLQAETEAIATAASASTTAPYGSLSLQVQPRAARARQILASRLEAQGGLPLTTGYSGSGQQAVYAVAQQGSLRLFDANGALVSAAQDAQLQAGLGQVSLERLPAPGRLTVRFSGDSLSSYLAHYRASESAVAVDFGRWEAGASSVSIPVGTRQLPALRLNSSVLLSAMRSDHGAGRVSLSLLSQGGGAELHVLQQAAAASPQALSTSRIFRSGSEGWHGSEGAAQGGSAALATSVAAGTWLPQAQRDGVSLAITGLEVVGNAVQASFEGGVQALFSLAGTGTASNAAGISGMAVTVRRLGRKANGLAFYEADPVTGALLSGPRPGLQPGEAGYLEAALAVADQGGLVRQGSELPGFGEEAVLRDLPLRADRNYGLLLLVDGRRDTLFSSYAAANPGGLDQVQAFAASGRGLTYGLEDLALASGRSDRDFNDLIVSISASNPVLST